MNKSKTSDIRKCPICGHSVPTYRKYIYNEEPPRGELVYDAHKADGGEVCPSSFSAAE